MLEDFPHTIAVYFVHLFFWYSNNSALLNDFRIDSNNMFDNLKFFHGNLDID